MSSASKTQRSVSTTEFVKKRNYNQRALQKHEERDRYTKREKRRRSDSINEIVVSTRRVRDERRRETERDCLLLVFLTMEQFIVPECVVLAELL